MCSNKTNCASACYLNTCGGWKSDSNFIDLLYYISGVIRVHVQKHEMRQDVALYPSGLLANPSAASLLAKA